MPSHMEGQGKLAHAANDILHNIGDNIGLGEDAGDGDQRVATHLLMVEAERLHTEGFVPHHHHDVHEAILARQQFQHRIDEANAKFMRRQLVEFRQKVPRIVGWF